MLHGRRPSVLPCLALLLCVAGCGGSRQSVRHEETGAPTVHRGSVVRVSGSAPAEVGASCQLEVSPVGGPVFNCRVRVLCDEEVIYGLPEAGFNTCETDEGVMMSARDGGGTRRDGDPKMEFDLEVGRVVISDRDPDMEMVIGLDRRGPPSGMVPEPPPGYAPGPGAQETPSGYEAPSEDGS